MHGNTQAQIDRRTHNVNGLTSNAAREHEVLLPCIGDSPGAPRRENKATMGYIGRNNETSPIEHSR